MIDLLEKIISFPSDENHPRETNDCFDFAKNDLKNAGLNVREFSHHGCRSLIASPQKTLIFRFLLNGHLDVVPAEYPKAFKPSIKKGRIYGRGAGDMKGVVSAMMELIKDKEIRKTSTGLLLTTDEEIGGENGVGYLVKNNLVKTDCVIVPDGGENFKLILAEKGVLTVQILAEGRSVHGSRPWLGENAILKLIRLFEKINLSLPKLKPPAFWQPTVNLGMLQGGTAPNVVPGKAFMRLNFRFPEIKDEEIIIKLLDKEVSKIKGLSFEITSRGYPLINKPNDPFLNRIRQCAQAEGINLNLIKEHGASDGRFFSQKGIPVIMFKPVCSDSHIDNEWIDLKSLETFSKILKRFLLLEK